MIRKLQRSNDLNLVIVRDADHTFSKLEPRGEFVEAATRLLAERYAAPGDVGLRAKEPRARRHEATPS